MAKANNEMAIFHFRHANLTDVCNWPPVELSFSSFMRHVRCYAQGNISFSSVENDEQFPRRRQYCVVVAKFIEALKKYAKDNDAVDIDQTQKMHRNVLRWQSDGTMHRHFQFKAYKDTRMNKRRCMIDRTYDTVVRTNEWKARKISSAMERFEQFEWLASVFFSSPLPADAGK